MWWTGWFWVRCRGGLLLLSWDPNYCVRGLDSAVLKSTNQHWLCSGSLNCLDNQRYCTGIWGLTLDYQSFSLCADWSQSSQLWVWHLVCVPNCGGKTNTFPTYSLWAIFGLQRWSFYSQLSNPQVSSRFLSCWGRVHKARSPSKEIVIIYAIRCTQEQTTF